MQLTAITYPLLFGTGLVAGFVDSIAGGGGLITLPVLLSFGMEPQHALGTNKLQASFGSGSATWHYAQGGAVPLKDCTRAFLLTFLGAALGAWAVQQLDPSFLRRAIPILLILVAVYMVFKPRLGAQDLHPRMARGWFDLIFGLAIGFYDGFFGPGTGTFWTMAFMLGLGFNMTRATGYTKVMNFASNLSSLAFFLLTGKVFFVAGLVMGVGQLLGARMGARLVIAGGTRFIRPVFLTVVLALTLKLIYDGFVRR
ncbi:MAG TPA: TSUP family transporter [Candidatus Sulfotelmatobacter sp.]|nr:TSUP family transporter [Candidatus Sulfotelmatobacter sp.]